MTKRIVIRNKSRGDLGVMLEPWTDREDVGPDGTIMIDGEFVEDEIIIDVDDSTFLSVWVPPGAKISVT